jgi:prepilin-type N-terminal cleavage/methylation domain-containing protein
MLCAQTVSRPRPPDHRRGGFTLVELLVVITIIAILFTFAVQMIGGVVDFGRRAATESTLRKLNGMIEQRLQSIQRATTNIDVLQNDLLNVVAYQQALNVWGPLPSNDAYAISATPYYARKLMMMRFLPQSWDDLVRINALSEATMQVALPTNPNTVSAADSSEALYFSLSNAAVIGDTMFAAEDFGNLEVGDTDRDGLLEFLDGWGRPIRFYRWPTRLIRPLGPEPVSVTPAPIPPGQLVAARLLMPFLPASRELVIDPDDPYSNISRRFSVWQQNPALSANPAVASNSTQLGRFETGGFTMVLSLATVPPSTARVIAPAMHTPDTWHTPLLVSAGSDGVLGLYEPNDFANLGHLAMIDMSGAVGGPISAGLSVGDQTAVLTRIAAAGNGPLNDNMTNLNIRGGNR